MASATLLTSCSINDSRLAVRAQKSLLGLNEVTLQTCLGVPDEKSVFGTTEILTYYATSTSSSSYSIPVIGGISFSNGGYCHTIIRLDNGLVTTVRYTGENRAFAAPDAYCAPTVGGCVTNPPAPTPADNAPTAINAIPDDRLSRHSRASENLRSPSTQPDAAV
jgi:hypothetical protein